MFTNIFKKTPDYDDQAFKEAQQRSTEINTELNKLNVERKKYADLYFMDDYKMNAKAADEAVVETISPGPHDKVLGAVRLMTATEPNFALPKERNKAGVISQSDPLEQLANLTWTRSNLTQQRKVERDLALTGFLFDDMHIQIISTHELLKQAQSGQKSAPENKKKLWEARIKAAEMLSNYTPYLYEAVNPMTGHALRSRYGIEVYERTMDRKPWDIYAEWGERAKEYTDDKSLIPVKYHEQWDLVNRIVWVEGKSTPIMCEPHGLPIMIFESTTGEGTDLFPDVVRQREPLLYGVLKSGVWASQNVVLTAIMSNVNALINAGLVFTQADKEDEPAVIEYDVIGNTTVIPPGAKLESLIKQIINPDSLKMLDILDQMFTKSTLYDQALGQPISGSDNFSMVSLLAQAGRLPLIGVKTKMELMLSSVQKKSMTWLRLRGQAYSTKTDTGNEINVKPDDIPEYMEWKTTIEPDLPQDKMQMATLATTLTTGDDPIASHRWVRENIVNIGQPREMQKEIWGEKFANMRAAQVAQEFFDMMKQKQMAIQAAKAAQAAGTNGATPPAQPGNEVPPPPDQVPAPPPNGPTMPEGTGALPATQAGAVPMSQPVVPQGQRIPAAARRRGRQ